MTSKISSRFLVWARITLFLVYAVILAGAVVRATGSGMGCPDWPKCFGHYIPPTDISQLQYEEGREFKKGHFIIWNEALWKAKKDVVAGKEMNPDDWEKYTKHDYAKFNPSHTWTEYVNRLMGALLGIASFITLLVSLRYWKSDKTMTWLSALAVFLIGFEAWLGAKVVDSNLAPAKITTHMIVALIILAVVIWMIDRVAASVRAGALRLGAGVKPMLIAALIFSLLQTAFGTQVREEVDVISDLMQDQNRELWIEQLGVYFNIHRLFALAVFILNAALVWQLYRSIQGRSSLKLMGVLLMALLIFELGVGIVLAKFGIPAAFQPVHLLFSALIFGLQFKMWMEVRRG